MKSGAPTVSICVPAYARPDELRTAIGSVLSQSFRDLEVVVSDDSGDLEPAARSFDDDRVRYFRNPTRLGVAGNYEAALSRARGRFVGILDDDDWLLPGFIETVVSYFDRDPSLGVVVTARYMSANGRLRRVKSRLPEGRHSTFLPVWLHHMLIGYPAGLMRREVWAQCQELGSLPDLITADALLWIRPALLGWPFYYVDEPLLVYRQDAGGVSDQEELMRDHSVRLWESFEFEDDACERLRRHHLGVALTLRAGTHLKHGRPAEAHRDTSRAKSLAPGTTRTRRLVVGSLASYPRLLPPLIRIWHGVNRLRGTVASRLSPGREPRSASRLSDVKVFAERRRGGFGTDR